MGALRIRYRRFGSKSRMMGLNVWYVHLVIYKSKSPVLGMNAVFIANGIVIETVDNWHHVGHVITWVKFLTHVIVIWMMRWILCRHTLIVGQVNDVVCTFNMYTFYCFLYFLLFKFWI